MDKELVSSFEAALKRFSAYEKSKPLPSGYAFIPTVNRMLKGNREWYRNTWNKYAPGPFDVANVGSWFGDLKGRRIPWVQTKGRSSAFPLVIRGFDSEQSAAANRWAQRSMQWRYSFDDVRKQNEVKLSATSSTDIVPYDVGYAAKQSAKYGFVGPMPDESFYGPTRRGATGFEAHATKARLNKIKESFRFAMLDKDEQFIRGAMRDNGWSRDQAEQVYFRNLTENTKWLRLIARDNPKIIKSLVPIAKVVGKAGNIPILGGLVKNPALTAVGMYIQRASQEAAAAKSIVPWRNLIAAGGDISVPMWSAIAGSGADYASALQLGMESSKKAAGWKFGAGLDNIFKSGIYGSDISMFDPMASGEDRLRMIYNANKSITNPGDRLAALELWGASIDEYNAGRRLVEPRGSWSLEERIADRVKRWKTSRNWRRLHGKGWDKISADWFEPDWWIENQSIGDERAASSVRNVKSKTVWELIREIAGIDDAYRSGEYDNSVTNNETNNGKSLTVINNWGGVSVEASDPVGLAEGLEAGIGNKFIGSREVAEWFDTKAVK